MAEIVMAYSAAHAPMQAADPGSAPPEMGQRWFEALKTIREQAQAANPQAAVMLSGEHFTTNYFLACLPQVAIGLADKFKTPDARWLNMEGTEIKGQPALAHHITEQLMARRWWPALSHEMEPDHGFLTVYNQLDPSWQLPLVPVVMNCTSPPLMTLRDSSISASRSATRSGRTRASTESSWWLAAVSPTSSASRGSATSTRSSTTGSSGSSASRASASCSTCRTMS